MNNAFLAQKQRFGASVLQMAGLCLALGVSGCIDSPSNVILPVPTPESVVLDSVTSAPADRIVDLFQPSLDPYVDGQSILTQYLPVRVREADTGSVVEYQHSARSYQFWNAQHEFEYNLLLLRIFFLKPPRLFENVTGDTTVAALYARAAVHDRFTRYVDSASAPEFERNLFTTEEPKVLGFLLHLNDAGDSISLRMVAPVSPAYRAGLRRGMVILAVNDSAVTGDSAGVRFLRFFPADTAASVKLTVLNPSNHAVFSRVMTREQVDFPTVVADHIGSVGYIAIYSFTGSTLPGKSTYSEFHDALTATRGYATTILDLRGNGGGSLNIALQMCEEVLTEGILFKVVERRFTDGVPARYEVAYRAHAGEKGEGRKFVLLADSGSASASELFIAALRERLQTAFVGTHTYGKGVGQVVYKTPGGGYSLVTYGRVQTASGSDYNGTGLMPTRPSTSKSDAMLAEAAQAASAPLAKGAAAAFAREAPGRAAMLEWNRREAKRSRIFDLTFPGELNGR